MNVEPAAFNVLVDGQDGALGDPDPLPVLLVEEPPHAARINVRLSSPRTPRRV